MGYEIQLKIVSIEFVLRHVGDYKILLFLFYAFQSKSIVKNCNVCMYFYKGVTVTRLDCKFYFIP